MTNIAVPHLKRWRTGAWAARIELRGDSMFSPGRPTLFTTEAVARQHLEQQLNDLVDGDDYRVWVNDCDYGENAGAAVRSVIAEGLGVALEAIDVEFYDADGNCLATLECEATPSVGDIVNLAIVREGVRRVVVTVLLDETRVIVEDPTTLEN